MGQNPFLNLLGRIAPQTQMLQQFGQMAGAASNPQAAVQQMMQNDPRIGQVMNFINQNGGDARALFYRMAQQKGIDPNVILNQAKTMMPK